MERVHAVARRCRETEMQARFFVRRHRPIHPADPQRDGRTTVTQRVPGSPTGRCSPADAGPRRRSASPRTGRGRRSRRGRASVSSPARSSGGRGKPPADARSLRRRGTVPRSSGTSWAVMSVKRPPCGLARVIAALLHDVLSAGPADLAREVLLQRIAPQDVPGVQVRDRRCAASCRGKNRGGSRHPGSPGPAGPSRNGWSPARHCTEPSSPCMVASIVQSPISQPYSDMFAARSGAGPLLRKASMNSMFDPPLVVGSRRTLPAGPWPALGENCYDGCMGMQVETLASGPGWSVRDVVCSSGPRDRRFEEQHTFGVHCRGDAGQLPVSHPARRRDLGPWRDPVRQSPELLRMRPRSRGWRSLLVVSVRSGLFRDHPVVDSRCADSRVQRASIATA